MKIDVFLSNSEPAKDSKDRQMLKLLDDFRNDYGSQIETAVHIKPDKLFEEHNITVTPALVIEDLIKIVGVVPSKDSLLYALKSTGLE